MVTDWDKMRELVKDLKSLAVKHNIVFVTVQQPFPTHRVKARPYVNREPDICIIDYWERSRW